ncbi:TPA: hypothetical protein DCY43_03215 [candidate division WWE3 bacterium]|uniref:EamA domain-containing protein n=3 Tax=Katanobacteria TaxID=422282 RepID=A0A0G1KCM1_UNCKA|nr:MAG: hypothetical protein UW36_C0004G0036 [candidate division WWE3 bacterium GW2011_GWA2_44_16]OGC51430.1 MAG: hypothetical protein A2709_03115 [candidate division WWE3 bacterium RIFCSPHIGHO2_01_FULL_43_9]HAZ29727.1 hypothetical protein [candidate division WWE3 bacterium]
MTWLLLTLVSPTLNALVNFIDKYMLERVMKGRGIGSLTIISSLMGLPIALLILLVNPQVFTISLGHALLIMLNGLFYILWVLPYLYALDKDEASIVMPLFQLASVMSFILAYIFLGETLTITQMLGCVLVLAGGVGISLEKVEGKVKVKTAVLGLVLLSCFFIAVSGVIFKYIALEETFWVTSFWETIGIFLSTIPLFAVKSYRTQFAKVIKSNGPKVLLITTGSELLVAAGRLALNLATLLVPISLVYFVDSGFSPFFVLVYGIVLTRLFPRFVKEKIDRVSIAKKLIAICVMFAGTFVLSFL